MTEFFQYDWRTNVISHDMVPEVRRNTPSDKKANVQALRNLLENSDDEDFKESFPQDDATLTKFLYARKFDASETFQLMQNYYWYRKKHGEMFKNLSVNAPDIEKALEDGLPGVLASKDRKGRCVLVLNANNWDCTSYTLISIYRSLLLSLEHLVKDVCNQCRGFVVIVDWTEFSFRQSTNLNPSTLKLMIEGLQDCFPAKFKGIHFIGQPWYVEAALALIKPFFKENIKNKICLHGNNLSTLHDSVHKDILPTELGGEQPSYNPEIWLKILKNQ